MLEERKLHDRYIQLAEDCGVSIQRSVYATIDGTRFKVLYLINTEGDDKWHQVSMGCAEYDRHATQQEMDKVIAELGLPEDGWDCMTTASALRPVDKD